MKRLKRLNEYVDYHIKGDGECNGMILQAWADKHHLSKSERIELCYFFSITYCVESAIVMYLDKENIIRDVNEWISENKNGLIFQSDRKYIRMRDTFNKCLLFYRDNIDKIMSVAKNNPIDLRETIPFVESWPHFGRFSAYLLLETVAWVTHYDIVNAEMEWERGNTATSGLLNLYGYDKLAGYFDKTNKLVEPFNQETLQKMVEPVLEAIRNAGGNDNITMVETSLCAYRKFFKGSRYNGYYLDRMLEEILFMRAKHPKISEELLALRSELFDYKYLGEISGWKGIRKECKKLYKETGRIM